MPESIVHHIAFYLAMAAVVAVTLYVLGPQAWRGLKGDDPFEKPLSDEWRPRQ